MPANVKPPRPAHHAQTRIWFWNNAGAQTFVCPAHEAQSHRERLIASGAVVWHTDIYDA